MSIPTPFICGVPPPPGAFTSTDVISTSPRRFLTSIIDFIVLLLFELLKKQQNFTSPIAKSSIVIFRVKVSCITSVDGIILRLLVWLVNYVAQRNWTIRPITRVWYHQLGKLSFMRAKSLFFSAVLIDIVTQVILICINHALKNFSYLGY